MPKRSGLFVGQVLGNGSCIVLFNHTPLPLRLDLVNHSPTGFAWGYEGSGPAQLALAMLAMYLNDDGAAMRLHQHFKRHFVARLRVTEPWSLTTDEMAKMLLAMNDTANLRLLP